ncbi:MAG: CoA transferase [Rhodospirillaceae bacterium]|nr:CoA transferase [Rhodospirillaceae bacterium]MYB12353.1 CoA transferase [Rhodospirillaceae bacterium]MYI48989.1 CoA transferase [Rhodospirillaceae bacterium]
MPGPLDGLRVVELAGIGPGPMACMMLADMGADVVKVDRLTDAGLGIAMPAKYQVLHRGRPSIAVDLKSPDGLAVVKRLIDRADVLIEGFRPGVTERMGLGPEDCFATNPKLVYGRMTGWGQDGPMARAAGHDMNYIALTGALNAIGPADGPPVPPLNLVGDFGGGTLYLLVGVLAALLEARQSGKGQVVDAAMVDGAASLMTTFFGLKAAGLWSNERGANLLDGGAHFYSVYETRDGKYVSIGSIEAKFYAELLEKTGLDPAGLPPQMKPESWPVIKEKLAEIFRTKTRDEWCAIMEGSDICFAPILDLDEAPEHPHMKARGTFAEIDGVVQPAPAPRFSRTPGAVRRPPSPPGADTDEALVAWGFAAGEIADLRAKNAVG